MPSKKFVEKSGSKKGKGKKSAAKAPEGVTVEGLIEQGNVALSSLEVIYYLVVMNNSTAVNDSVFYLSPHAA